jgi:hypothetical protein
MEQTNNILRIINSFGEKIYFSIEPYGMVYTMGIEAKFTVVLRGNPENNLFEIVVNKDGISVYGTRETMTIFDENGVELTF